MSSEVSFKVSSQLELFQTVFEGTIHHFFWFFNFDIFWKIIKQILPPWTSISELEEKNDSIETSSSSNVSI